MCAIISAMTSPLYPLGGWSDSLITRALIGLLLSWKASPILNDYNLPLFHFPQSLSGDTKTLQEINSLTLRASTAARLTSISGARGFLRFLWIPVAGAEPSGVWAICACSQQVITD